MAYYTDRYSPQLPVFPSVHFAYLKTPLGIKATPVNGKQGQSELSHRVYILRATQPAISSNPGKEGVYLFFFSFFLNFVLKFNIKKAFHPF